MLVESTLKTLRDGGITMESIRVLHVVSSLSKVNGIMSVLMNIYRKIDRTKLQFDFVVGVNNDLYYKDEINKLGGNIYIIGEPSKIGIPSYINKVNEFFNKHKDEYNILHCHLPPLAFIYLFFAKKYGIPHRIMHSHATMYGDRIVSKIRNFILQLPIKKLANNYIACSEKAGSFLFGKNAMNQNRVYIMKNSIDASLYKYNEALRSNVRDELGLQDELVVGHVGAFLPVKNHSFILDVFKKLDSTLDRNCKLLLVGDGPLVNEIKEKIKRLGLSDKVILTGIRSDVHRLMMAMDMLVLPSFREGLPMVGVESQAASLPTLFSSTITKEVEITEFAHFLNIYSSSEWINKIISLKESQRYNTISEIKTAGFDSDSTAAALVNYYTRL